MPKGIYQHKKIPKETKKRMSESAKRVGTGKWMKDRHLSKETRIKMSLAQKGKPHPWNKEKKFSEEYRKKLSKAQKGNKNGKGNKNHLGKLHTEETKRKIREARINNPNKIFKNTSIELKIETELQSRNINYQKQVPLCKIAIVDFYLPEYRVVIQCDGCFYHGCPKHNSEWIKNKERDENQDRVLIFNGFNVYRFWEHEINQSTKDCINKIKL